ncbi:MAG: FAD-binding oxidoreductase [Candidatus Hydrogenedentota bacterium]|jgi:FAD/FMN-containing dehydrogenase/Fe-S oxidoreductase|uniref:Glycolate dehydrogenase n=1 Tax=Sumerlaea chitinivorans TaxID=2250252 RepID=A0A2Z4Y8J7_SUMC1|nr:Glycolate dehydrogenase [Candidatus Sumerlaea chitinivorans]RMH27053.1 MAG: FAD-binding oxidoreductase [Candidatus Hydrogenedentota bacterium]
MNTATHDARLHAQALEERLRREVVGEVRFDTATRAMYATDSSNYRQVPIGVVIPRSVEDVLATVAVCRAEGVPILSRGGGTSLAGQCCNVAVILDFSKYLNRVVEVDPARRVARVQPGTILDDLHKATTPLGLTFGPDPATHDRCTIGGMIGNNSCGIHSVQTGRTSDNIEELEILTVRGDRFRVGSTSPEELEAIIRAGGPRGEIYRKLRDLRDRYAELIRTRFPRLPRRVSGFNLDELLPENGFHVARALVGTEGTCVTFLEATVRLVENPPVRTLLVLGYPDVFSAAEAVPEILTYKPVGLEGMDDYLRRFLQKKRKQKREWSDPLPEGTGWLLIEFGGETQAEAEARARELMAVLAKRPNPPSMKLPNPQEAAVIWEVRKSGLGATAFLPDGRNTWPGWEDAAVPPENLAAYLRDFAELRDRFGYESAMYGHFGDGCVHMRLDFDFQTREGVEKFKRFLDEAGDLIVRHGGSMSGEHGDGQARAHLLPKMFGPELVEAFREFKRIWDPDNLMNPGKVVDAWGPADHLRLGPDYRPWSPVTYFAFPDSRNDFARAMLRCVGVGRCRRLEGALMCPSFMATREEKYSTRGRSRLLQEMIRGEVIRDRWRSKEVKEALDLCLSCKGCKTDCPTNVDMATYKAEFFAHHYEGRIRPLEAYALGLIDYWARLASLAPSVANALMHAPGLSGLMKKVLGIAPEREMPRFAPETFRKWFFRNWPGASPAEGVARRPAAQGGRVVILWADTFNNHFLPRTLRAGLNVLEAAGWYVVVPRSPDCCGRPLYDVGMLRLAKRVLQRIMTNLREEIEAGLPIVVLEPSCASVFRDELPALFPQNPLAQKLSEQVFLLAEFLAKFSPDWQPPAIRRKAVFHGHCHHKAVMQLSYDTQLLERMGIEYVAPEASCCGMAGAFGFKKATYEISMKIAERALLPAVRAARPEDLIIMDGFSCREQIRQATGRLPMHLAEVIEMGLS